MTPLAPASPGAEDHAAHLFLYQEITRNALAATGERRLRGWTGPAETLRRGLEAVQRVTPGVDPLRQPLPAPHNPVLEAAYRRGEARLVSFREATEGAFEPRFTDIAERMLGLRSSYLCPLKLDAEVLGVLSFHYADPPDEREQRVCEAFAAQAALTLENARLTAEARAQEAARADQAEEIARVLAAVGAAPDVEGALEALILGAARLVPSTYGITRTFDPDTGERDHEVAFEPDGTLTHKVGPGLLPPRSFGQLLRQGSGPMIVHDYAANDPAVPADYSHAAGVRRDGIRAAVHMPIESDGRVIGNLSLNHPEPGRFGPREVAVLGALTSLAGAAIDRARLHARQRRADAEHAAAQARLAEAEREGRERYERLYRDLPLPAFTWQRRGEDFVLLDGNTAADHLTSGILPKALGSTVVEIFGAEPHFAAGFERALTKRSSHTVDGVHRFLSAGETRHIRMTYVFQAPDLVVVYPVDLTDQDARESAERQKAKLDGALLVARTTAHEINNALAPVTGYAELMGLRPAVKADAQLATYAALIGAAAQDAAARVHRLQSIVRLQETPSPLGSALPVLDMDASTAAAR